MSLLHEMYKEGARAVMAAFKLPKPAPLKSVGMAPPKAPDLPATPRTKSVLSGGRISPSPASPEGAMGSPANGVGVEAAKVAFNVGMGASQSTDGAGAQAGDPADTGRRQRSVVDRTFQANDDNFATSSMPLPGAIVSP